jgi:hypothetical protein
MIYSTKTRSGRKQELHTAERSHHFDRAKLQLLTARSLPSSLRQRLELQRLEGIK